MDDPPQGSLDQCDIVRFEHSLKIPHTGVHTRLVVHALEESAHQSTFFETSAAEVITTCQLAGQKAAS